MRLGPRGVLIRRELQGLARERSILLAVLLMATMAGFSSFLMTGLTALVDPSALAGPAEPSVAVNETAMPADLRAQLVHAGVRIVPLRTDEAAWGALRDGVTDAALLVTGSDPARVQLGLPDGDLRASITMVHVKKGLEAWERDLRASEADRLGAHPPVFEANTPAGGWSFVHSLLIPLLALLPVVVTGALCADTLTEEMQRGTLPVLLVSPARMSDVVEAKLLANALVAPLLAGSALVLLTLAGTPVPLDGALGVVALVTAAALGLGVLACGIALLTRDRTRAQTLYASAFFLALAASLAAPVSPINAVARLAAGSADATTWAVVAGMAAFALLGVGALRVASARIAAAM